jgi:hypothetical protein
MEKKYEEPAKCVSPANFFLALLTKELVGFAVGVVKINKLDSVVRSLVMGLVADGAKLDDEQIKCGSSTVCSQTPLARKLGDLDGVGVVKNVISSTSNHDKYLSSSPSFVPLSGIELDLDAYINDLASCQLAKRLSAGTRCRLSLPPSQPLLPPLLHKSACIPTRGLLSHPLQKLGWHCPQQTLLLAEPLN